MGKITIWGSEIGLGIYGDNQPWCKLQYHGDCSSGNSLRGLFSEYIVILGDFEWPKRNL